MRGCLKLMAIAHRNIVPVYGLFKISSCLGLVGQWEGCVLHDIQRLKLAHEVRESLARDVIRGLAHLHSLGIVGTQLTPDTVCISSDGNGWTALISEPGFHPLLAPHFSSVHTAHSTLRWWSNGSLGYARDMFTLSGIVYMLLTQEEPAQRSSECTSMGQPDDIGEEWWSVLQMCWADDPPTAATIMRVCNCEQTSSTWGSSDAAKTRRLLYQHMEDTEKDFLSALRIYILWKS
ncbi:kinase-like domain-containing protein [Mycena galericulata]|nr:kinase-like domain-containing protein [Mycena galericulata]